MKHITLIISLAMIFALSSCQNKENQAVQKETMPKGPIIDTQTRSPQGHGSSARKMELQVVVPPEVESQWSAVTFIVRDKKENTEKEMTVNIGDDLKIPGSTLTVKTGPFLPDFKMSASTITSVSNEPKNPSVGVKIFDNGKKIFPSSGEWGWLYTNFPTIHSFQHERFGLVLKEGVRAGTKTE